MSALPSASAPTAAGLDGLPNAEAARPHLYTPGGASRSRDIRSLFNFRRAPGYYNAKQKVALLRQSKTGPADEWFVDFSGSQMYVEGRASSHDLTAGTWTWQAKIGGESLVPSGNWREVCWHRDAECDYLEIELPLASGWKLGRQMLLARKDRFLFLADRLCGRGKSPREMCYRTDLPLVARAQWAANAETRDGRLSSNGRTRARLVPLALPEWRAEFLHAELTAANGQLSLSQAALGSNLYAPLWIDLDRRRVRQSLTWRRLTVGENLSIVPRSDAVAYRVQAGRQQWVFYQSLTPAANRTFLGHNTFYSFVCSRFLPSGNTQPIVAIE